MEKDKAQVSSEIKSQKQELTMKSSSQKTKKLMPFEKPETIKKEVKVIKTVAKIEEKPKAMIQTQKTAVLPKPTAQKPTFEKKPNMKPIAQTQIKVNQLPIKQKPNVAEKTIKNKGPIKAQQIRLIKPKEEGKEVAAIIVSFCGGHSYDNLFTSIEQKTMEGTQVLVYSCESSILPHFLRAFEGEEPENETLKQLMTGLKEVDSDCVVFNWECCSSYSSKLFPEGKSTMFTFLKKIIDLGYMAMFSDFSLKALIKEWDAAALGKNPFEFAGETQGEAILKFRPSQLKECPSAQLQLVGDLADGGICKIECLDSTILYTVNPEKVDKEKYKLEVLTINTTNRPKQKEWALEMDDKKGTAGHVLLRYESGGCLLTSMGHWVELMKIDTSDQRLFEIAEREYGEEIATEMKREFNSLQGEERSNYVKSKAVTLVQSQAPCKNMNSKKRAR